MIPRRYRPKLTPTDLYSKMTSSFIKAEALIEESWADGSMGEVIEFHGEKLVHDVERQIAFLQAFLRATRTGWREKEREMKIAGLLSTRSPCAEGLEVRGNLPLRVAYESRTGQACQDLPRSC